ncbi:P-loop containing nucleoside triphosphate hydrolase protein [Emericellopsis atlantica]|uniref:P-loop containing nucleoside triphosphate hydrolase protein n=1 Tax=Emericellopsis atlantica TaxID=2614577 RepID=A0A9P8CNS7_9HYPO|nr:P-loop containing nucleoside triphosphate hydrolase protein [Emericellopsis atlantica]KAG9254099.1 P-loop containing nucleoside triphosphate hydrolase protein [Emericellopsis atlantica]
MFSPPHLLDHPSFISRFSRSSFSKQGNEVTQCFLVITLISNPNLRSLLPPDAIAMGQIEDIPKIVEYHVLRRHQRCRSSEEQLDLWQTLPELPLATELLSGDPPDLPYDYQYESPRDKNDYLRWQYLMYRYEGVEFIRRAIAAFQKRPHEQPRDAYVHTQARVQGYTFSKQGAAARVAFSTDMSKVRVDWENTSRLTPGTLIALSPKKDGFRTKCLVATVAARPILSGLIPDPEFGEAEDTPPRIDIFWSNPEDAVIDPLEEMFIIEPKSGYFEPVRHAMIGLQHAAVSESCIDKYTVNGHTGDDIAPDLVDQPPCLPAATFVLDNSQHRAFQRMTSRELAIIQGPPGTGKTYTSVTAIRALIWNRPTPIIVAAQTNHALDQLLLECMQPGSDGVAMVNIARLGSRSQDEAIQQTTLYNLRTKSKKYARGGHQAWADAESKAAEFESLIQICFPNGLIPFKLSDSESEHTETQDDQMAKWLGSDQVQVDASCAYVPPKGQSVPKVAYGDVPEPEKTAEEDAHKLDEKAQVQEKDKERLRGKYVPIKLLGPSAVTGVPANLAAHQAANEDLYDIPQALRRAVYRHFRQKLVAAIKGRIPSILQSFARLCDRVKIGRTSNDVKLLKEQGISVVGCTLTGLTKYRALVAALEPKVLLVEEAAETREPNITSALFPSLDQLILVGDHQQLVPSVDADVLTEHPFNLHVSLFERLVKIGLPFTQLQVQRRMTPSISKIVRLFYPDLEDHEIVKSKEHRPPVPGLRPDCRLKWFRHEWPESRSENMSYDNLEEAKMIAGFTQYLVQNGLQPADIAILSFYNGQVELIQRILANTTYFKEKHAHQRWSDVVRTVDGFQGEQNEVVILSVVRSGDRPGFVQNENRAVVALSRAKRGMFIFGNDDTLRTTAASAQTWGGVLNILEEDHAINNTLEIVCQRHNTVTTITKAEDWEDVPGGGCGKPCGWTCPEGHQCTQRCHRIPHPQQGCSAACKNPQLSCGHPCRESCGRPCRCRQGCGDPKGKAAPILRHAQLPMAAQGKMAQTRTTTKATTSQHMFATGDLESPALQHGHQPGWEPAAIARNDKIARAQSTSPQKRQPMSSADEPSRSFRELYCQNGPADNNGGQLEAPARHERPSIAETYVETCVARDGQRIMKSTSRHTHSRSTTEEWETVELIDGLQVEENPKVEEMDDVEEDLISFEDLLDL